MYSRALWMVKVWALVLEADLAFGTIHPRESVI